MDSAHGRRFHEIFVSETWAVRPACTATTGVRLRGGDDESVTQMVLDTTPERGLSTACSLYAATAKYQVPAARLLI